MVRKQSKNCILIFMVFLIFIVLIWGICVKASNTSSHYSKYKVLLELKDKNYTKFTVQQFRDNALNILFENGDEKQNQELLSEALGDEIIQAERFSNKSASFIRNVLVPLTSESWKNDYIYGCVKYPLKTKTSVTEFRVSLEIKNTSMTVKEYEAIYSGLANSVQNLLSSKSDKELLDDITILEQLEIRLQEYASEINAIDNVSIVLDNCFYVIESNRSSTDKTTNAEIAETTISPTPIVDEFSTNTDSKSLASDVKKILTLKVDGYKNYTLTEYRTYISEKLSNDSSLKAAKDRVMQAISSSPEKLNLSNEDFTFIAFTLSCSIAEIAYDVSGLTPPSFDEGFWIYSPSVGDKIYIEYGVNYTVDNPDSITIDQRDAAIMNVVDGMRDFTKKEKIDPASDKFLTKMKNNLNNLVTDNTTNNLIMEIVFCTN